ncbi:MAG: hypothetical protein WD266_08795 [Balneolales bacterium]
MAQMFTVQSEQAGLRAIPQNTVVLGFEPTEFSFRGDDNTPIDLSFSDPVYRLRAELSGFEGYIGIGYNLGDADSLNLFNAGAKIGAEYRIVRSSNFFFAIPLSLSTDYIQIGSQTEADRLGEFRQSSAMVGLGVSIGVRYAQRLRIESRALPMYGFSVTSFGGTGGTRASFTSKNRIYLDHVFDRIGLSAGFDFKTSRYNLDEERFNYDLTANSFVVGVTF